MRESSLNPVSASYARDCSAGSFCLTTKSLLHKIYPQVLTALDFGRISRYPRPQTLTHEYFTKSVGKNVAGRSQATSFPQSSRPEPR